MHSFFLVIAILQFFHQFSTISPGLVILPLIVVLGITAVKDGYEDIKRHQSDRRVNLSVVRVLKGGGWSNPNVMEPKSRSFARSVLPFLPKGLGMKGQSKASKTKKGVTPDIELGQRPGSPATHSEAPTNEDPDLHNIEYDHEHEVQTPSQERPPSRLHRSKRDPSIPHWRRTPWEDVRVGDFVKLMNEESFPADILICATSEEENVCYVETKNLDGETNLKSRNAVQGLTHLRSADACADRENHFRLELDRPDPNLYKLNGAVATTSDKYPIDLQTVLLRGTVLKNTRWVIGIVMFTGEDAKIVLNAGGTPSKRSRVERQMNPQVYVLFISMSVSHLLIYLQLR